VEDRTNKIFFSSLDEEKKEKKKKDEHHVYIYSQNIEKKRNKNIFPQKGKHYSLTMLP
jgi:CRISPR/Cas system-associated protein Csx1